MFILKICVLIAFSNKGANNFCCPVPCSNGWGDATDTIWKGARRTAMNNDAWRRTSWHWSPRVLALLVLLVIIVLAPPATAAAPATLDLGLDLFASGFSEPTDIASAGDSRLFVTELAGLIRIVQADGVVLPTPFLDLQDKVIRGVSEIGLMGLVFAPGDATTFYVHYVDGARQSVIARYHTASDTLDQADPASEQVLLTIDTEGGTHVGGALAFGPDGYLYIPYGTGPGGGSNNTNGQNLAKLLGKVLRIQVTGEITYTIPPGNPFAEDGDPNTLAEIWSYGWRNPWKLSFDRVTGEMFVSDVGQNTWEEINVEPPNTPGRNYGWKLCEGSYVYPPTNPPTKCPTTTGLTAPVFDYSDEARQSVTGGYVYRGSRYPNMVGHYLFADFISGSFWSLVRDSEGTWTAAKHGNLGINSPVTFGEDKDGELYVASHGGTIYRITASLPPVTPPALTPQSYLPFIHFSE